MHPDMTPGPNSDFGTPVLYNDQPVITLPMIDQFHERPEGTARNAFNRHRERLIEGEDFVRIARKELATNCRTPNVRWLPSRGSQITLLFESGYLLLTKPFGDDRSWLIMRELVRGYFKAKETAQQTDFLKQQQEPNKLILKLKPNSDFKYKDMAFGPEVLEIRDGDRIIELERVQKPKSKKAPKPLIEKQDEIEARRQDATRLVESIRAAIQDGRIALEDATWKTFGGSIEVNHAKAWSLGQRIGWHVAPRREQPACVAIEPSRCAPTFAPKMNLKLVHDLLFEAGALLDVGWRHAGSPIVSIYRMLGDKQQRTRPRLWLLRDDNGQLTGRNLPPVQG